MPAHEGAQGDGIPPRFRLGDPQWLLELRHLPWPVDWAACFGREGPLHVELGFGDGAFLAALARRLPEANLVGVERALEPTRWALRRLRREGLSHVRLVLGEAFAALAVLFPPDSIAGLHINFPDPWPKARHHHRRLLTPAFLHLAAHRLRPGGAVTIATDDPDYAGWIAEALAGTPGLHSRFETAWVPALPDREPTRYERKAQVAGRACFYFVWERIGPVPPPPLPRMWTPEGTMPHRIWKGDPDLPKIEEALRGRLWQDGEAIWRVVALYRPVEGAGLLIELLMAEGLWVERVALRFQPHGPGLWILKPAEIGSPRPTLALRQGVQAIARTIEEAAPALQVLSSTI
ncbi:tRNA (guanosine(46)-N7)-methyltransferase TrmB [Thermoflexus sp.]|uniref:tRNA (guanosine(46)-N7)-methyltransferase TrmB n=1 Tax=Thermoflexus sp. TaxID=1969742 RepID=UPI00331F9D37